jgi:hypothetical protein
MKLFINADDRKRHIYLSGKTQYGKTTLMISMAYGDMRNGMGLCFIDAKGKDMPTLLDWVPAHRKQDVIYLDLETPVPIDFMATESDKERNGLVSDIIQIFNRMEDGLGSRMGAILRWTVSSLHLVGGGTFMDIYYVLTRQSFRDHIRQHPEIRKREEYRDFWDNQAEKMMKGESGVAIAVTRMTQFILSEPLRVILGTKNAKLNIAHAIRGQKIILVRLEPNSDEAMLFGSLIVSKIQQAIFRRKSGPPFALYVDEFQNFKTSGFEKALAEGGGLGLWLTLANQYFGQLDDTKLERAIIDIVSTFFLFNQDPSNAQKLVGVLREPEPQEDVPNVAARTEIRKTIELLERDVRYLNNWNMTDEESGRGNLEFRQIFARSDNLKAQIKKLYIELGKPGDPQPSVDDIRHAIKYWKDRESYFEHEEGGGQETKEACTNIQRLEGQLSEAKKPKPKPTKPISFIDRLPSLPPGQAVYRAANGDTVLIKTPLPPNPRAVGKTSHARWILEHTLSEYGPKPAPPAESSTIRTVDNASGHSATVRQTEGNGIIDPKSEDIQPTAAPRNKAL